MHRKNFIASLLALSAVSTLKGIPSLPDIKEKIKPPKLKRGDTVGIITPGSYISESELRDSIKNIEALGLKAFYTGNVLLRNGYFSGNDKQRADDLHLMFRDEKIKAIICARGGYGCARLLPLLDFDLIRNNPKVFIGYSDVTALLYGIYSLTGLVCFHGPVGISTYNPFTLKYFRSILFEGAGEITLISEPEPGEKVISITSGTAKGIIAGGNLSVLTTLIGTPYDINLSNSILFLEETGEEPYRIDRMLTHLLQAGKFDNIAGVALGVFKNCEPKKVNPSFEYSFSLIEVLTERLKPLNVPVVYGLSFGHVKNKFTLPFGILAELNTVNNTISLLEKSVI